MTLNYAFTTYTITCKTVPGFLHAIVYQLNPVVNQIILESSQMLIASHNSEADEQLQMDEYDMANSFNSDKVSVHTAVEKEGNVEYDDFDFEGMCHEIRKERRRIKKIVEHNCAEFVKESHRLTNYTKIIIALVVSIKTLKLFY